MNLDQAQIKGTLYDLKDRYKWTGTQAQWDALDKSTLPQDVEVIVNITDDYDETSGGTVDVLDTLEEINANTTAGKPAGALAVKELNNSLSANSKHFYFDYKNGKYGYNTDPNRGADTFVPFKSGDCSIQVFASNNNNQHSSIYGNGLGYVSNGRIYANCNVEVILSLSNTDNAYAYVNGVQKFGTYSGSGYFGAGSISMNAGDYLTYGAPNGGYARGMCVFITT